MAAATAIDLPSFDAAYLRALNQGDEETEQHFFHYFTPLIRARLRKYLRSSDLVQDAMQETFARVLAAVRARNGVRHPERFGAFVHAVCRNVALETWRSERRFVALEDPDSENHAEVAEPEPGPFRSPHRMAEAAEARERVRKVLAELSSLDRQLLVAVFLDEEERGHVCQQMRVSRAHLRILLFRAKQRFLEMTPIDHKATMRSVPSRDAVRMGTRKKAMAATVGGSAIPFPL
ncbi:MAG TPA: sigma-70 family RNA polymerase sigma factor [Candidatus Angelobacter sp.]|nr:sigma-70 family RNA polymerase sigma factor [Candidatus Angelobacter sp.]